MWRYVRKGDSEKDLRIKIKRMRRKKYEERELKKEEAEKE